MAHHAEFFMKNKKITKVLKEAIDSPLGSTKRKAAKNLIHVMNKVADGQGGGGYYGQGGPGVGRYSPTTPGSASFVTKAPRKDPDYSNMIIFPSPPAPHRGKPMTHSMAPAQAGQGAQDPAMQPASQMAMGITNQAPAPVSAKSNFNQYQSPPDVSAAFSNVAGPGALSSAPSAMSQLQQTVSSALTGLKSSGQGGPGSMIPYSYTAPDLSGFTNLFKLGSPLPGAQTTTPASVPAPTGGYSVGMSTGPGMSIGMSVPNAPQPVSTPAPQTGGMSTAPAATAPFSTDLSGFTPVPGSPPAGGSSSATGTTDTSGSSSSTTGSVDTTGSSPTTPTPPVSDVTASLNSGISNNMGATAWAQSAMANSALMKEIFPGMNIPASGSLTDAVKALQETLQSQYGIKDLQNQLLQMTADGVTLGPMLQTYIQNKDVSLNAIHQQQLSAQDQMLHSDQGNPYESAIWSRYSDYLNNIYTAQNASYADFFNKSTTMYSNALSALNTTLSNSLTQYNNELSLDTQLTEADYNRMYQGLTDMYTAAQNAPMQQLQMQTMQKQLSAVSGNVITSGTGGGNGDWIAEYKKLTDMGVLFDNTTATTGNSNSKYGTLMSDVSSIGGMLQTIVSDNPKIGLDGALYIVGQGFQKTLQSLNNDPAKAIPAATKYQGMILQAVLDGVIPQATGLQMAQELAPSISQSVSDFIVNTAGADNAAKGALVDALVGSSSWWGPKKTLSLPDFESKYSTTLGKGLADAIYQSIQAVKTTTQNSFSGGAGTGTSGPAATAWYGNMSPDQIYQSYADKVNKLATPQAVGDYVGQQVNALIAGSTIQALNQVGQ